MKYLLLLISLLLLGCSSNAPKIGTCYKIDGYVVKLVNVIPYPGVDNEYMFQIVKPKEAQWLVFTVPEDNFKAFKDHKEECPNE